MSAGAPQRLSLEPRLDDPDEIYSALVAAHRDLPDEQAHKLTAKLVLLLANHIGDEGVIREAIALAREQSSAEDTT